MLKEKIEGLISKDSGKDNKKKIENIVVFIIILIVVIIAINTIWNDKPKQENDISNYGKQLATTSDNKSNEEKDELETKLEKILYNIEGVGDVKVLITYSETSEIIAMYNETKRDSTVEEEDSSGGKRVTQNNDVEKEVIYDESNGNKVPMTQKVIEPKIEGAIVTAVGAENANTKNNIIQAVEAVTGLATHKIQVFEMKKN